jgi:hypothetical protein
MASLSTIVNLLNGNVRGLIKKAVNVKMDVFISHWHLSRHKYNWRLLVSSEQCRRQCGETPRSHKKLIVKWERSSIWRARVLWILWIKSSSSQKWIRLVDFDLTLLFNMKSLASMLKVTVIVFYDLCRSLYFAKCFHFHIQSSQESFLEGSIIMPIFLMMF